MDGSFLSPPAKRSIHTATGMFEPNNPYSTTSAINGASSKRSKPPPPPLTVPAGRVAFRLLCHASRIGGVIGKSGTIIKQLQQDTGAKIRVEESPPGSDERVIVVIAPNSLNKKITLKAPEGKKGDCEEIEVSAAQEAVIRVFERILDVAAETDGVSVVQSGVVSCRLLAETSQVGSVIGKGGKVIEKIRKDSGCKIRVLNSEKLPACAQSNDEMIEIEGDIPAVKKALVDVSRRLQDCPPVDRTKMIGSRPLEAVSHETLPDSRMDLPPQRNSVLPPMPTSSLSYASGGHTVSIEGDRVRTLDTRTQPQEVVFKLLCSNDRVGGVIGKGGTIVKALQNETGASISVGATVADCDERLITVTAMENPETRYSPAQNAVNLVFNRSVQAGIEKGLDSGVNKGSPVSARLVVPSYQVGCLLGKGGAIISEMRKATGAGIRIIGGDQVPKCASENEEVVQITGEFTNVQDALYNVTGRLRDNLFPSKMLNGTGTRSSSSVITEISPYASVREPPSLGLHSSVGVSHGLDRHITLTQSMDHLGLSHNYDHPPSPRLWASQTVAGVNPRSIMDVGRGLTSVKGGLELGSGSRSAIVTNTTVEIVVPENVIGSVYGENGSNLTRLRQISGAKVIVHEPHPGTTERIVVISGSPDETQAAQSLLQAFILTGPS
uniref:K Homology domain-containing protein n=1 Tax=Davidia involucrata TaxID=16924 RepID=A0A5B7BJP2_DAVIN